MERSRAVVTKVVLLVLALVAVIGINFVALGSEAVTGAVGRFGYIGIFTLSALSGFNIIFPIPIASFFPIFTEAGFTPVSLIVVISLGMMVGDLLGYLLGTVGRDLIEARQSRFNRLVTQVKGKHPRVMLTLLFFYAAFVPMPNELLVVPMAFHRYSWQSMAVALFFGNILFTSLIAFGATQIVSLL